MNGNNTVEQTGQENALAVRQPQAIEQRQAKAPMPMGSGGIRFDEFESLFRFAMAVSRSGLAPKGIQTPDAIAIAIQMGLEVGLPPMTALQNIAVINGRPSIWGDAQLGIVRASGQLERYEEAETNNASDLLFRELCLEDEQGKKKLLRLQLAKAQAAHNRMADDFGVTVFVQRRGFEPIFNRFTIADAKKADLWGKQGPWNQYPARMLKFRARSFALRDQFGDALKGLLTAEEAGDMPPAASTAKPNLAAFASAVIESTPAEPPALPEPAVAAETLKLEPEPAPRSRKTSPAPGAPPAIGPNLERLKKWMIEEGLKWDEIAPILEEFEILTGATHTNENALSEDASAKVWTARAGIQETIKEKAGAR